jgi:hypothetical protein
MLLTWSPRKNNLTNKRNGASRPVPQTGGLALGCQKSDVDTLKFSLKKFLFVYGKSLFTNIFSPSPPKFGSAM